MKSARKKILLICLLTCLLGAFLSFLTACFGSKKHEHEFAQEWKFDGEYHWHEQICNCGETAVTGNGKAEHTYPQTYEAKANGHYYTCTECGYQRLVNHRYGEWEYAYAEICTDPGTASRTCSECDHVESKTVSGTHTFGEWADKDGIHTHTCTRCSVSETHEAYLSGYGRDYETKPSSCTESGYSRGTCNHSDCTVYIEIAQEPTGHNWSVTADDGMHRKYCWYCREEVIAEHTYGEWTSSDGEVHTHICGECDYEQPQFHTYTEGVCSTCRYTRTPANGLSYTPVTKEGATVGYAVSGIGGFTGDSLTIPEEYNGKPVIEIAASAFIDCTTLKSVSVPSSVVTIGAAPFSGCRALQSLTLPFVGAKADVGEDDPQQPFGYLFGTVGSYSDFMYISQPAYYNGAHAAISYKSFYIPKNLRNVTVSGGKLCDGAFYGCTMITNLRMQGVQDVHRDAFLLCDKITELTLGADFSADIVSVTTASDGTVNVSNIFREFHASLQRLNVASDNARYAFPDFCLIEKPTKTLILGFRNSVIPSDGSVEIIGSGAFGGVDIRSVVIPASVHTIEAKAFSSSALEELVLPNGIQNIGQFAFYSTNLKEVELPGSVRSIGKSAFEKCRQLERAVLREGTLEIGESAFQDCELLASELVFAGNITIGKNAFGNCKALRTVRFRGESANIGESAFGLLYLETVSFDCDSAVIGDSAFLSNVTNLANLTLGGVTSIGKAAFQSCMKLNTELVLSAKVKSLGEYAFYGCSQLPSLTIEEGGITRIPAHAFMNCSKLTAIRLPDGLLTIESDAFRGCFSLTEIVVPDSVTRIGFQCFAGCKSLETVTLPFCGAMGYSNTKSALFSDIFDEVGAMSSYSGLTAIVVRDASGHNKTLGYLPSRLRTVKITGGDLSSTSDIRKYGAFEGCTQLTSVLLDGVTKIGTHAFSACTGLSEITIPESCGFVDSDAFTDCSELATLNWNMIKSNVSSEIYSFRNCGKLANLNIGGKVEEIPRGAFANLTGLKSAVIPDTVVKIGRFAFAGCTGLESLELPFIGETGTAAEQNALFGYIFAVNDSPNDYSRFGGGTEITQTYKNKSSAVKEIKVRLPAGLREVRINGGTVAYGAFSNCSMIESLVLNPKDITHIPEKAFYGCSSLAQLSLPSGLTELPAEVFFGCSSLTEMEIPETVTAIGAGLFSNCSKLSQIALPDGVTEIPENTFLSCTSLQRIKVSDQLTRIGVNAFRLCSALTAFAVPAGVTEIPENAFRSCKNLASLTIPSVVKIGESALMDCTALKTLLFPAALEELGNQALANSGIETVSVQNLQILGGSVFYNCKSLRSVELNGSFTQLLFPSAAASPYGMFENCTSLSAVTLPDGLDEIQKAAFRNCQSLQSFAIPQAVTTLGESVFEGAGLTSITIPANVRKMDRNVFKNCAALETVTYNAVNTAGAGSNYQYLSDRDAPMFGGCDSLTSIIIGADVAVIPAYAFYGTGITEIDIPTNVSIIKGFAYAGCSEVTAIRIAEGRTDGLSLYRNVFAGADLITSLTLPEQIVYSEAGALAGLKNVRTLIFRMLSRRIGYLFGEEEFEGSVAAEQYESASAAATPKTYYVPLSLKTVAVQDGNANNYIPAGAFSGCGLTEVSLHSACLHNTEIVGNLFRNCSLLNHFVLSDQATVTAVGEYAFAGCSELERLNSSYFKITTLGVGSFKDCIRFLGVGVELAAVTVFPESVFEGCGKLQPFSFNASLSALGANAFKDCVKLSSITIPDNAALTIGAYAFSGCTGVLSVTFAGSVHSIGSYAFRDISKPTDLSVGNVTSTIGEGAFSGWKSLTSLSLPFVGTEKRTGTGLCENGNGGYRYLFGYIFGGTSYTGGTAVQQQFSSNKNSATTYYIPAALQTVTIAGGILAGGAFYNCSMLRTVNFGGSAIGWCSFNSCTNLTSFTIASSVTFINSLAFSSSNVQSVTFADTTGDWKAKTVTTTKIFTPAELATPSQNATYFTSSYRTYEWTKL